MELLISSEKILAGCQKTAAIVGFLYANNNSIRNVRS